MSRKQLLKAEFKVFARLGFALFVPPYEYDAHFQRLLRVRRVAWRLRSGAGVTYPCWRVHVQSMEVNELDYLGPKAFETYASIVRGAPDSVASTGGDSAFSDDGMRDRAFAYDADADGSHDGGDSGGVAVQDAAAEPAPEVAAGEAGGDEVDSDAEAQLLDGNGRAHAAPVPTPPLAAAAAELVEDEV